MFLRAMAWKELREQRLQIVLLTMLGLLVLLVAFPMWDTGGRGSLTSASFAAIVFAWAGGMVTGAVALANERETHTQVFLDTLPRWRMQVWGAKLFVAVFLVIGQSLLLSTAGLATTPHGFGINLLDDAGAVALFALLSGLYGLACGLCGSALARTVLAAIGWAMVALVATGVIAGIAVAGLMSLVNAVVRVRATQQVPLGLLAWALTIPLPMTFSALVYSRLDRQRRFVDPLGWRRRLRITPTGVGLRSALWLSMRQGWPLVVGLIVVVVLVAPLSLIEPLAVWPILTTLVGVLMGIATLGDEQFYGSFRFLAEQRLPLGRLWLFKVGSRFLMNLLLIAITFGVVVASFAVAREVGGRHWRSTEGLDIETAILRQLMSPVRFMNSWLEDVRFVVVMISCGFYGFAFGHLSAMLARKSIVALAIALMTTIAALAVWIPTLLSGGLPIWQLLAVPTAMLILARLSVWAWATDRLLTRRWIMGWSVSALAAVAFVVACMANRALEVPSAPVPFDVAEFNARFPSRSENQIRNKLFLAEDRFETTLTRNSLDQMRLQRDEQSPHATLGRLAGDRVALTLIHGWPKNDEVERQLAERMIDGDWLASFLDAAKQPPMPVEAPADEYLQQRSVSQRAGIFGHWVAFGALYLQSRGKHAEALDLLIADLTIARRLMDSATRKSYANGMMVEASALAGLHRWCEAPDVPAPLLERALAEALRHDAERPPYLDVVKAEYVRVRDYQTGAADVFPTKTLEEDDDWRRVFLQTAVRAPWEKLRRQRLLNSLFAMQVPTAQADYVTLHEQMGRRRQDPTALALFDVFAPLNDQETLARNRRLAEIFGSDLVLFRAMMFAWDPDAGRFLGLCQTRGLQLRLALLLFQLRHGRMAEKLSELVPSVLPAVPLDPFSRNPFQYRKIDKDEWVSWAEDVWLDGSNDWSVDPPPGLLGGLSPAGPWGPAGPMAPMGVGNPSRPVSRYDTTATSRRLRAGTALVWSVGPDTVDDGGVRQYTFEPPGRPVRLLNMPGTDILFPVPQSR